MPRQGAHWRCRKQQSDENLCKKTLPAAVQSKSPVGTLKVPFLYICRWMRSAPLKVRVDYPVPSGDRHTPGSAQLSAAAAHSLRCMEEREREGGGRRGDERGEREVVLVGGSVRNKVAHRQLYK